MMLMVTSPGLTDNREQTTDDSRAVNLTFNRQYAPFHRSTRRDGCNELTSPHPITSSARATRETGTSMPRASGSKVHRELENVGALDGYSSNWCSSKNLASLPAAML